MKPTTLALALSLFAAAATAAPKPEQSATFIGSSSLVDLSTADSPITERSSSLAIREGRIDLWFCSYGAGICKGYNVPLNTAGLVPIDTGIWIDYIQPWVDIDNIWCAFWGPNPNGPSLQFTYGADKYTRFSPAASINYFQCCNGVCPNWPH